MQNPASQEKETNDATLEATLQFLEREQKAFNEHWIWQKLRCKPEEFFQAFQKHVAALHIPQAKWDAAYRKVQDEVRIRAKEKRQNLVPLHLFAGLRV